MTLKQYIIIFLLGATILSKAQDEIRFSHLKVEDGLPDKIVYCMLQDSRGYVWIGTESGLARFDGNNMVRYYHSDKDSTSLANDRVNCMYQDSLHTIWIGTDFGLSHFDPVKKRFINYYFEKWSAKFGNNNITNIAQDNRGMLWVSTNTGIYTADPANPQFTLIKSVSEKDYYGPLIHGIKCTSAGRMFILMDTALLYSDDYCKTLKPVINTKKYKGSGLFTMLYQDKKDGDLWFGDYKNEGTFRVNPTSLTSTMYSLDTLHDYAQRFITYDFCRLNDTIMMVGTLYGYDNKYAGGLFFLNTKTHLYWAYYPETNNSFSLSNNRIWCMFKDNQNNIWLGTENGINRFNYRELYFHWSITNNWGIDGLTGTNIVDMCTDKTGNIWMGTSGDGLIGYSPCTNKFSRYHFPFSKTDAKRRNTLFDLYPAGDTIYIGEGGGYSMFKIKTYTFDTVSKPIPELQGLYRNTARGIARDKNGIFWFGTYSAGLYSYDPITNTGKHYFEGDTSFASYHRNYIKSMAIDTEGNKWVGTYEDGFYCIKAKTNSVTWNEPGDKKSEVITRGWIYDISCDNAGNTYMATQRDGIIVYNDHTKKFRNIRNDKWPEDNKIRKIVYSKNGVVWLATCKGLSCWDLNDNRFLYYPEASKISTMNEITGCASQNGEIYFAGGSQLLHFNTKEINDPLPEIHPEITSISIMNKEYLEDISKPLYVNYYDNIISFTFSAFDFQNESQDQFAYYLEGFNNDWNYCRDRHFASYTNLPGGDYVLHLKVQDVNGDWTETAHPISIHVTTPYWKTWWFFTFCGLIIFALGSLFYYLRIQREIEAEKLRKRLARDLHDDIGSSLSSIFMISKMAMKNKPPTEEENQFIFNKISESSHKTMESMNDIVWIVNPENDSVELLLTRMRMHYSEIMELKGIEYSFNVTGKIGDVNLYMEQRRNFYLIFKEAVNNLAKYSKCSASSVTISIKGKEIEMNIADNGIGFNTADASTAGNGLKNMKDRAKLLNGKLSIESKEGQGTSIALIFFLP